MRAIQINHFGNALLGCGRIVTGAGPGVLAHRRVFDAATLQPLTDDFPFGPDCRGGLYVG